MPSLARDRFETNRADVERLWEIHQFVAGDERGRKYRVDVINRAAIVFICACWESFVEDLAADGLDFLVQRAPDAKRIPNKLKGKIYDSLDSKNGPKVWDSLTDESWRELLISRRSEIMEDWLGKFHTPKAEKVAGLFEGLLGLRDIREAWFWQKMSKRRACEKLDELVRIRGAIAHRTVHDETIHKSWTKDYLGHIAKLVDKTEIAVGKHLEESVGSNPWPSTA